MTAKDLSPQILQILSLVRLKADCKITPTRVDFTPLNKYSIRHSDPMPHPSPYYPALTKTRPSSPPPSS